MQARGHASVPHWTFFQFLMQPCTCCITPNLNSNVPEDRRRLTNPDVQFTPPYGGNGGNGGNDGDSNKKAVLTGDGMISTPSSLILPPDDTPTQPGALAAAGAGPFARLKALSPCAN